MKKENGKAQAAQIQKNDSVFPSWKTVMVTE